MIKPIDHNTRMMSARTNASLIQKHWDVLSEDDRKEMIDDLCYAVEHLMEFRNIINGMVGLNEPATDAVKLYLDE